MLQRPTLVTPPTVAYVTVVLTTLTAIDLGQIQSLFFTSVELQTAGTVSTV